MICKILLRYKKKLFWCLCHKVCKFQVFSNWYLFLYFYFAVFKFCLIVLWVFFLLLVSKRFFVISVPEFQLLFYGITMIFASVVVMSCCHIYLLEYVAAYTFFLEGISHFLFLISYRWIMCLLWFFIMGLMLDISLTVLLFVSAQFFLIGIPEFQLCFAKITINFTFLVVMRSCFIYLVQYIVA